MLATGGRDGDIVLLNMSATDPAEQLISQFPPTHTTAIPKALAFSADGSVLVSGSTDSKILLWDWSQPYKNPEQLEIETDDIATLRGIALTSRDQLVAYMSTGVVLLWDLGTHALS